MIAPQTRNRLLGMLVAVVAALLVAVGIAQLAAASTAAVRDPRSTTGVAYDYDQSLLLSSPHGGPASGPAVRAQAEDTRDAPVVVAGFGVAQDIAVSPVAPRALPLNRPVGGSATQNAYVQNRIAMLRAQGATRIRVNQQQVNINGTRVGVNRPDLQYTLNGKRYYEEFDIPSSNRGPIHKTRLRANDPKGEVKLFTVP